MIEIKLVCIKCEKPLIGKWARDDYDHPYIDIEPCPTCLEKVARDNYREGLKDGG